MCFFFTFLLFELRDVKIHTSAHSSNKKRGLYKSAFWVMFNSEFHRNSRFVRDESNENLLFFISKVKNKITSKKKQTCVFLLIPLRVFVIMFLLNSLVDWTSDYYVRLFLDYSISINVDSRSLDTYADVDKYTLGLKLVYRIIKQSAPCSFCCMTKQIETFYLEIWRFDIVFI